MPLTNLAYVNERRVDRDEVHHRTSASEAGGRDLPLMIVNISPAGLMARCDLPVEPGMRLVFRLPDLDPVPAEVRWVLGGRVGCEFDRPISPTTYYAMLSRLTR